MPSVSEALAERVMDAGALKVWLFVGEVRLIDGGWLVGAEATEIETLSVRLPNHATPSCSIFHRKL